MPIEDDFTNTLRAELGSYEPDLVVLLGDAVNRGRRRRRRRASLVACAGVLVAGGLAVVAAPALARPSQVAARPARVVAVPAKPGPHERKPPPSGAASPTLAKALSSAECLRRLRALLPSGVTVSQAVAPGHTPDGAAMSFRLDDGRGVIWRATVSATRLFGSVLADERYHMLTVAFAQPDGTLVDLRQQPDSRWQAVDALRPDGLEVSITLSPSAVGPNDAAPAPILSSPQLIAVAADPAWETAR
ncbi:hypothetical protein ABH931_007528 [Streptacidiphilus sp. MAP12-33]|uniref:hypothetical protein n=1 Tax=Streptacidiphilus sp. MAP12-33 TaxID=3156266 RepID=UPI003518B7DA